MTFGKTTNRIEGSGQYGGRGKVDCKLVEEEQMWSHRRDWIGFTIIIILLNRIV